MSEFQRIGIVGRPGSESVKASTRRLAGLLRELQKDAAIEEVFAQEVTDIGLPTKHISAIGQWADLVIVVGGDGTLLGAARDLCAYEVPILGINRGRLGFLTDIMPDDMERHVKAVLAGNFVKEDRFLLQATIVRDGVEVSSGTAMNDVVLHPGQAIRMISFELSIDEQFVYSQRSDGLIISTPTGSTAYSLSAGGPIMHPKLDALVLVPMFPHALSSRPLVVAGDAQICIQIVDDNTLEPMLSCDAQTSMQTQLGDLVRIKKLPHRLHLLHPTSHNYYDICRNKLGWGKKLVD